MKTDMYLPTTGQHYLAAASQVRVLMKTGWVIYSDWLAEQGSTPAPDPEPTPVAAPTDTTSTDTGTTPAPSL